MKFYKSYNFKAYKKDNVILFDLILVKFSFDEDDPTCFFESNLTLNLINKALLNYEEDCLKLDFNNSNEIQLFLESVCEVLIKMPEAPYFYYPANLKGRILEGEDFIKKLMNFDVKAIKLDKIYSLNENTYEFYCVSIGFSHQRIFETATFNKENKRISRKEFEAHLLPEYSKAYVDFFDENNLYFICNDEYNDENLQFFVLTDSLYFPLLFFCKISNTNYEIA